MTASSRQPSPLDTLIADRTSSRVLKVFAEHVKQLPNSWCRIEPMPGRRVAIGGKELDNFNAINYLGLEHHPELIAAGQEALARYGGSAGSARAAAEMELYGELESRIEKFLGVDSVIVFTTVALAGHGVIPLLMKKGSLMLVDWEAHSSVQRAALEAKGGGATLLSFKHDDFAQLEGFLAEHRGQHEHAMILLDGIYSMLGTYLDLPRFQALAEKYNALLYIDDAHGFGVVGPGGRGIVSHFGATYDNIIYAGSLSKALASLGAFVVAPRAARDLIRYSSPTYIFSGQLPPVSLATCIKAFDILEREGEQRLERLRSLINYVKQEVEEIGFEIIAEKDPFPLILVKVGNVYQVPWINQFFYDEGIHILTVGFPVIPLTNGAMVRISLSPVHSDEQVERLLSAFRKLRERIGAGFSTPTRHETKAASLLTTG